MKSEKILRHVCIAFFLTVIGYGFLFSCDMKVRTRRGAWDVVFIKNTNGEPALIVNQKSLGLSNITLIFSHEKVPVLNSFVYPTKTNVRARSSSVGEPPPQPALGFKEVIPWANPERNTVTFDKVLNPIPFGRKKFEDLTYLPGTLAFDFFGHEVQFMPRTMVINLKEVPWTNNSTLTITADQKIPGLKDRNAKGLRK
jgi:hypothetical protein